MLSLGMNIKKAPQKERQTQGHGCEPPKSLHDWGF